MQLSLGIDNHDTERTEAADAFSADSVLAWLAGWEQAGWLRLLDLQFARFLHAEKPQVSGLCLLAAALVSHQLGRGHVCLDLAATLAGPTRTLNLPPEEEVKSQELPRRSLTATPILPAQLLGHLSQEAWEASFHPEVVSDGSRVAPLVYERGRLYLYRYWRYERQVANGVQTRLSESAGLAPPPLKTLRTLLNVLFGPVQRQTEPDWQRLACALAARQHFAIITGGPGTGKTTTVVRLLALLQALHLAQRPQTNSMHAPPGWQPLRIRLAAPTGKAAARLSESIAAKLGELPLDRLGGEELAHYIPSQVVTLHRLLGSRPHIRKRTYSADNLLPLDVLVVDEASMVSLSDMADLMAALPPKAKLVLIGDKDQLTSVEAGSVLGELCARASEGHYLPDVGEWLAEAAGQTLPKDKLDAKGRSLDQAVAMLRFSHRFAGESGIGRLALSVNEGDAAAVAALLEHPTRDLAYLRLTAPEGQAFTRLVLDGQAEAGVTQHIQTREGYGHYLRQVAAEPESSDRAAYDAWAAKVLHAHRSFQILTVLRKGPWGVEGLNVSIARVLYARGLIPATSGWYIGRPVMVTRNNPALRLTNGDIGVVLPYPAGEGETKTMRVAFPDAEGAGVRWFAPNRLDDVETVYALTVHKSQGSEFNHSALVLPPSPTPILTRELLYTGITRASSFFTLINPGGEALIENAVLQRIHRSSGLADLLCAIG